MNWNEVFILINTNIYAGLDLDPANGYRNVVAGPNFRCSNYENREGFRVQVGEKSFANLPMEILQQVYEAAVVNNGLYNQCIFRGLFPQQLKNRPCHVHAIGKLFYKAGVTDIVDNRNYRIRQAA